MFPILLLDVFDISRIEFRLPELVDDGSVIGEGVDVLERTEFLMIPEESS